MKAVYGFFRFFFNVVFYFVLISLIWISLLTFLPPPINFHQLDMLFSGHGFSKSWVGFDNQSKNFHKAVIAAEDARFMSHKGFDFKAIKTAAKNNQNAKRIKGGSTISMQTAKNVFLWHGRNYIRKAFEAYFTILIENIWGKKRILEVYCNIVELDAGVYGVEAAAKHYFSKSASKLSEREAALLAGALPSPKRSNPAKPSSYLNKRAGTIQARMNSVKIPK